MAIYKYLLITIVSISLSVSSFGNSTSSSNTVESSSPAPHSYKSMPSSASRSRVTWGSSNYHISRNIQTQDYYINYQNNLKIHLREKKPLANPNHKVVILLAPLSIPSLISFDISKYSLMDTLAQNGFDVWGVDFIGQGTSSYPLEMQNNPSPECLPTGCPLQASDAVLQLESIVDFINSQAKTQKNTRNKAVSILGWSWGSVVASMYAIKHPKNVDRLVLFGAMYGFVLPKPVARIFLGPYTSPSDHTKFSNHMLAYQNVRWEMIRGHWFVMMDGNESIVSRETVDDVGRAYIKADPNAVITQRDTVDILANPNLSSSTKINGSLRRATGPMKDLFAIWTNHPIYDISKLTTPTLVIYGDQDLFADTALFSKLTHVKIKKEVKLHEATHWLLYEKTRPTFNKEVINFLSANH